MLNLLVAFFTRFLSLSLKMVLFLVCLRSFIDVLKFGIQLSKYINLKSVIISVFKVFVNIKISVTLYCMKQRIRVWILVVLIVTLVGVVGHSVLDGRDTLDEGVLGSSVVNYQGVPYISSVPMRSLYVGELFRYIVEVSDLDTEGVDVVISLTEEPLWMEIEGNEIRGIPFESGTYKYVVTVSDGESSSSVVNYVLVEVYE